MTSLSAFASRFFLRLSTLLCVLIVTYLILSSTMVSGQIAASGVKQKEITGSEAQPDVIILVRPQTSDQAEIALVYQNPQSDERVRREINQLVKACGGKLDNDVKIETKSLQPNNLKRFPVRTGATFTLLHSPQVRDSAPTLAPYLSAFQSWNHVEVIFWLPDLDPYNGIERFENPALTIQLIKDPGVYRYEADIREHVHALPGLMVERKVPHIGSQRGTSQSGSIGTGGGVEKTSPTASSLPLALFLSGCALTAGVGIYLMLTRRSPVRVSPRSVRR